MKKSRKEFIKQVHRAAQTGWQNKIENEFPKLFKTSSLEVGKWYKRKEDLLVNLQKIESVDGLRGTYNRLYYYGFYRNKWSGKDFIANTQWEKELVLATSKEIGEALIKEAKKRGFPCKEWNFSKSRHNFTNPNLTEDFNFYDNTLDCFEGTVFKNGEWATIINTITKEEAEKELGKTIVC